MKGLRYVLMAFALGLSMLGYSQSCTTSTNDNNQLFFTVCQAGSSYTLTGNYTLTASNNSTIKINGNVTINGTLTINMVGSGSIVEVLSPYTLTATNITFTGSATGKNLVVDGPSAKIVVSGTLNFGGLNLDIDTNGTAGGSISAGAVTGGGNTTCASDGNCPTFTAGSCSGGGICNSGSGLPVTVTEFFGHTEGSKVVLKWSTGSELNFDYFEVEHSDNAVDFKSIGKVSGHGTSNIKHDYFFEDEKPLVGKNYYRLKSVDFDGFTEYFNVVAIDYSDEKYFRISPNPSDGNSIGFELNFIPDNTASVVIYDNLGMTVGYSTVTESRQSVVISNSLKSGIYYAKFIGSDFTKVERFVVR